MMEDVDTLCRQVGCDDPPLLELKIGLGQGLFFPNNGEWGRLGNNVGNSVNLRTLSIRDMGVAREDLNMFFGGLSANRSLEELNFVSRGFRFSGEMMNAMGPFFKNNKCLKRMKIICTTSCTRLLVTALAEFNSLEEFWLLILNENDHNTIGDNSEERLIKSLVGHPNLTTLSLCFKHGIGKDGIGLLRDMLQNEEYSLAVLSLSGAGINDETAAILATGLKGNIKLEEIGFGWESAISDEGWRKIFTAFQWERKCILKRLSLVGTNVSAITILAEALAGAGIGSLKVLELQCIEGVPVEIWHALFEYLHSPSCHLEEIILELGGNESLMGLSNNLAGNSSVQKVSLQGSIGITLTGWQAFSAALQNRRSSLESLDLANASISDESMNILTIGISNNNSLKELNISNNREISHAGWNIFAAALRHHNSALEKLDLSNNSIDDDTLAFFAMVIEDNSVLKELLVVTSARNNTFGALLPVLCNESSIMDTYNSNHTLQRISHDYAESGLPADIRELLHINRANCRSHAARLKIINTHFAEGFNVSPFVEMEITILPHAISWMARNSGSNEVDGRVYRFIEESVTCLFDNQADNANGLRNA